MALSRSDRGVTPVAAPIRQDENRKREPKAGASNA
jgi:hypothetical protein